jgi:hypothetical protein
MALTDPTSKDIQKTALKITGHNITKGKSILETGASSMKTFIDYGFKPMAGYQLRYIYLIDKSCKITVPILPFSKIDEMGAGMYKGKKVSLQDRKTQAALPHKGEGQTFQSEGAFDSTVPLNNSVINP